MSNEAMGKAKVQDIHMYIIMCTPNQTATRGYKILHLKRFRTYNVKFLLHIQYKKQGDLTARDVLSQSARSVSEPTPHICMKVLVFLSAIQRQLDLLEVLKDGLSLIQMASLVPDAVL